MRLRMTSRVSLLTVDGCPVTHITSIAALNPFPHQSRHISAQRRQPESTQSFRIFRTEHRMTCPRELSRCDGAGCTRRQMPVVLVEAGDVERQSATTIERGTLRG